MNYRHIYCVIISHAKSEEKLGLRKKGNGEYYEPHHILPKSLFPLWKEKNSNIVLLKSIDKIQENRRKTMENWSDEQKENYIKSHSYGALNSEKMKTAQLKYKKYKENGGKLKWNYWRHLGMPIEDNSSKAIEDKSENKSE